MNRPIFSAIPFLALGGLLVISCFDGSPIAGHSDADGAQADPSASTIGQNPDQNELAVSAELVPPDSSKLVSFTPTGRGYNYIKLVYFKKKWISSKCFDIRRKRIPINTQFYVPNDANLHLHAWISAKCSNDDWDRSIDYGKPPKQGLRTWIIKAPF